MKFGVGLENYGCHITFDAMRQVALAAEEIGYDSVWTTDHVLVPQADREPYGRIFECVVTLAMLAAITHRVRLGTSVIVLPMRNPVLFAKQIASIDAASGGRMIIGVGVGWNQVEYKNLNENFKNRGKRLDEDIQLLRTLWANEHVNFRGNYTRIADSVFAPLPAQSNGIPIWIGGASESTSKRVAAFGDGWHPVGLPPDKLAAGVKAVRESNPVRPLTFSVRLSIDLNPNLSPTYEHRGRVLRRLTGGDDDIRASLREYAKAGAEYIVLFFPMDDISQTIRQMERFRHDFAPEFMTGE